MERPSSLRARSTKKTGLDTLPPETLQLILLSLPDLPSLLCAALSSRTIYRCFRSNESLLVPTILQNQISPSVLTSALASLAAARIKVVCVETTREFFNTYLQPPPSSPPIPVPTRLREVLYLSRLHFYIRSFSRGFASRSLVKQPQNKGDEEPDVSQKEMERIERAFYRFEIYSNLFKKKQANPRHAVEDQIETFFCAFSGWEIEQLAIIHEFLVGLIVPAFNELAEHDILWGTHGIEPATNSSNEFIQAILAKGLPSLHRLTRVKTYHEKKKALYSPYPPYFTKFLYRGLDAYHIVMTTTEKKNQKVGYNDGDPGPEEAWKWVQRGLTPLDTNETEDSKHWKELAEIRTWAYVFWDYSRLNEWRTLQTPFAPPTDLELSRWETTRKTLELEESIKRRSAIHLAGGSGYWDVADESKIVWKPGKASPLDSAARRKECSLCFGQVVCAPHRLVLKIPEQAKTTMKDDGCFLELDMKGLDAIGHVSPKLELDSFRLSKLPPLQTDGASLFGGLSLASHGLNSGSRSYLSPTTETGSLLSPRQEREPFLRPTSPSVAGSQSLSPSLSPSLTLNPNFRLSSMTLFDSFTGSGVGGIAGERDKDRGRLGSVATTTFGVGSIAGTERGRLGSLATVGSFAPAASERGRLGSFAFEKRVSTY